MLKNEFAKVHWKKVLKIRIQNVFKNALSQKQLEDIQTQWKNLNTLSYPEKETKEAEIHSCILGSRILVATLPEFIQGLKLCGYDDESAIDVLEASQLDVQEVYLAGYNDIYGYGIQVTETANGEFTLEPMVLYEGNFDLGEDNKHIESIFSPIVN